MSEVNLQEITRESSLGYHMINTFQSCPRKWFLKYICGILPAKVNKALLFGKAWHEGMEVFYKGDLADNAYLKILSSLEANKDNFKSLEDYQSSVERVPILFKAWYDTVGVKLHDEYLVLEVEEELRPKLGDAFTMTIRPDAVVKHRASGTILIPEHKTTGYSLNSQFETVTRGDQATAYCWGLKKFRSEYALNFGGVLLDVCYNRGKVTDVQSMTITRNNQALTEFELSMLGVFLDLAQRIRALEVRPEIMPMLFPRNGSACSSFGCEYEGICRNHITPSVTLGGEFIIDPWKGREQLLADTEGENFEYQIFSSKETVESIQISTDA